jgi:hypothetical protein
MTPISEQLERLSRIPFQFPASLMCNMPTASHLRFTHWHRIPALCKNKNKQTIAMSTRSHASVRILFGKLVHRETFPWNQQAVTLYPNVRLFT